MSRSPILLEDVGCVICMEPLFCGKSDLDEILSICTTSCGHVFHDQCIREWFKSQLETIRSRRQRTRHLECPTCRSPCIEADRGSEQLQRLYINFGGDEDNSTGSSSRSQAVGESPARTKRDRHAMGLARRARDLTNEVMAMDPNGRDIDLASTTSRVTTLEQDLISEKAVHALKAYIEGLSKALKHLQRAIENNPLAHELQTRLIAAHAESRKNAHLIIELRDVQIPAIKAKARMEEAAKSSRMVEEERKARERLQVELEREKVKRRQAQKGQTDALSAAEQEKAQLREEIKKLEAEKRDIHSTLMERNKILKAYQAKVESRRELKDELASLKIQNRTLSALNEELEARLANRSMAQASAKRSRIPTHSEGNWTRLTDEEDSLDMPPPPSDSSIQILSEDIDPMLSQSSSKAPFTHTSRHDAYASAAANESLQIDMPSFSDDSLLDPPDTQRPKSATSRSTTARTYSFALDAPAASGPSRRHSATGPSSDLSTNHSLPIELSSEGNDTSVLPVPVSVPSRNPAQSFLRSRTNPFSAAAAAAGGVGAKAGGTYMDRPRKMLKASSTSTINLGSSTRPGQMTGLRQPLSSSTANISTTSRPESGGLTSHDKSVKGSKISDERAEKSKMVITGRLELADSNGRPKKGVVGGAKVRRLA